MMVPRMAYYGKGLQSLMPTYLFLILLQCNLEKACSVRADSWCVCSQGKHVLSELFNVQFEGIQTFGGQGSGDTMFRICRFRRCAELEYQFRYCAHISVSDTELVYQLYH